LWPVSTVASRRCYALQKSGRSRPGRFCASRLHAAYVECDNANERADKIAPTPLRLLGAPTEVAYGVLFLASEEASFVTATQLVIDGGCIA
jgi:NAD(P)-dependent dehydrogenase (short-subunit alcohol dehydrogenase family)